MDYKQTLNLPSTDFPMKANLARNEPGLLDFWRRIKLQDLLADKPAPRGKYTLHDGPPYANGHIHIGHALNKILKDFVVKSRTMQGYRALYIPGWDCHGLPIEHQVDKSLGREKTSLDKYQKRLRCREYAAGFIDIQREEFRRLGVFGQWDEPYLTMDYRYEAAIVRQLAKMAGAGRLYRGCKPVHWCSSCRTALAEAEVEYREHTSDSIYVKFPLEPAALQALGSQGSAAVLIWTTTPWTLPANRAVALHPDFDYVLVRSAAGDLILAKALLESVLQKAGLSGFQVLQTFKGRRLENLHCRHPFYEQRSRFILADYVTLEQGTGCVHTAPGHGQEDYLSGLKYGLQIYNPVDEGGRFVPELPLWGGESIFRANQAIVQHCRQNGALLLAETVTHSYPHCWRCKRPLIFRATEQWFISLQEKDLRRKALEQIRRVRWIPAWGRERIYNMVANRPDWCISRQRAWGVPITVFYCSSCGRMLLDEKVMNFVADLMAEHGSDIWFCRESRQLLPEGVSCAACGGSEFSKEMDILDVWFDSGVSYAAVLAGDERLNDPADLYLEGSDQHRGWFHSALLIGVANEGRAPYRAVLTHGFVVDGRGRKMSKSMGNVIAPQKIIERNGAEILRLWVASSNYREDVRISPEIIRRLTDGYRRIRNTCRFLLGNLSDFDPAREMVPYERMLEIDRWVLHKLQELIVSVNKAYQDFEFHTVYHGLHNFCAVTLSANYLDIIKDRLYCSAPAGRLRRSAQSALWEILLALTRLMAPILSFTAEEVWQCLPAGTVSEPSVHLASLPRGRRLPDGEKLLALWERFLACRSLAYSALENARNRKLIGSFMQARVTLYLEPSLLGELQSRGAELARIFIVSEVQLRPLEQFAQAAHQVSWQADQAQPLAGAAAAAKASSLLGTVKIGIDPARGSKCERCWNWRESVGGNEKHPTLCSRCAEVIENETG